MVLLGVDEWLVIDDAMVYPPRSLELARWMNKPGALLHFSPPPLGSGDAFKKFLQQSKIYWRFFWDQRYESENEKTAGRSIIFFVNNSMNYLA